jgi:hypothetical protein
MTPMSRLLVTSIAAIALAGCGGSDEMAAPEPTPPAAPVTSEPESQPQPEALPGLPAELAGYREWEKLNAEPIPPRDSDPHNGTKEVYASVPAEAGVYPPGTIVVKEAARPGASFIGLVAMMRKEEGANPEHNDWVMVEWVRDAPDAKFEEIAGGSVCTSCHMQVRDTDYVFTRRR